MSDLTDINYWYEKQKNLGSINIREAEKPEWLDIILPYLKKYEGGSFMEIGCCPGYVSALICSNLNFVPFGIDFSPMSHLYLETLRKIGISNATLYNCDIRDFSMYSDYDVVGSVGFIEHFKDPFEMLVQHHRLLRVGGLMFVVVPNFRYLQWFYHFLFDRGDLMYHNTNAMRLELFIEFSKKMNMEILFLNYCGRLRFWGVDLKGNKQIVILRRIFSRAIRELSNKFFSKFLPEGSKYYSPWIVYVAVKRRKD